MTCNWFLELEKFTKENAINSLEALNRIKTVSVEVETEFPLSRDSEARLISEKLDQQIEWLEKIYQKKPTPSMATSGAKSALSARVAALVELILQFYGTPN